MNLFKRTLLFTLLAAAALTARAQEHLYTVVEYMHIPEGKRDEPYIATEKLWQRLHQRAVDAGICQAWSLYRVENGGRADFATVRIYDSLDRLANPWPDSIQKDLYNAEETKTIRQTEQTRDLIQRELLEIEATAVPGARTDPSDYLSIEFMKPQPGKSAEYSNLEKNTYVKVHQARVKAGQMKNWLFLNRLFPSGTDAQYDFVTVNVYPKKDVSWDEKMIENALGKEAAAKLPDVGTVRTMVRAELWRPVLMTTPAKK